MSKDVEKLKIAEGMEKFFGRGKFETLKFAEDTCLYIGSFGNVAVVETDDGLVLFDLALRLFGPLIFKRVRAFSDKPVKYIIYSHGHYDHCLGYSFFIKEIKEKGWEMPQVIAHENLVRRFKKYLMLKNHQAWTYRQQFASVGVSASTNESLHERLDPTIIIRNNESYKFQLGNIKFEIYHDKGETDDSLWMFVPDKKVLFTGDLFVSAFPQVGSPFRVQRYAKDWALANEKMIQKNPEYLVPGHGPLLEGKEKIKELLSITAEAMHFVHDEVVKRLNEGKWFEEIYFEMLDIFPEKFKHSYLRPLYGDYRFAIHDVYRLYHGWYDSGNPTDLFPSRSGDVAKEFLKVADGGAFLERANKLVEEGNDQLALHILDVIVKAYDSANPEILLNALKLKSKIIKQKAKEEPSFIAMNIYNTSVLQIKARIKELRKSLR
jgi:alkyl sulfatase BDS1-like metallo-beta-lactamase superfamily hydrolase